MAPGANASDVEATYREMSVTPPSDYVEFMLDHDGGEGPVGASGYVVVWPIRDVVRKNHGYAVSEFAPSVVLFGSDGGDVAYGFDREGHGQIIGVPFVGMSEDTIEVLAETFTGFLERIAG